MRGIFTFYFGNNGWHHNVIRIPNIVTDQGEEDVLTYLFTDVDWLTADTYHLGLCGDANVAEDAVLADLTDEPTSAGGYARKPLVRNVTDFPVIDQVNGVFRAQSKLLTYTASGAAFSTAFTRAFICNVATGTVGRLLAFSGGLPSGVTLLDGQSFDLKYELYLD